MGDDKLKSCIAVKTHILTPNNQNQHKIKSFIHYTPTEGSTHPKGINHYHIIVISIPGHCTIYDDKLKSCIAVKTHILTPNNQNQHKIKSFINYNPTEGSTHPKNINHYHIIVISIPEHCTIYGDKLKSCITVQNPYFHFKKSKSTQNKKFHPLHSYRRFNPS